MVFKTILIGAQLLTLKIEIRTNNTVVLWAYWFALHLLGIHTALSALNDLRGHIVVVLSAQMKMQVSIDAVYSCLTGQVMLSQVEQSIVVGMEQSGLNSVQLRIIEFECCHGCLTGRSVCAVKQLLEW